MKRLLSYAILIFMALAIASCSAEKRKKSADKSAAAAALFLLRRIVNFSECGCAYMEDCVILTLLWVLCTNMPFWPCKDNEAKPCELIF